jgi:hypothetical protein
MSVTGRNSTPSSMEARLHVIRELKMEAISNRFHLYDSDVLIR